VQVLDRALRLELIDEHQLIQWDKKDLPSIYSLCKDIREGDESALNEWDSILNKTGFVQPLNIAEDKKYIMTFKGIAEFCRFITGQSTNNRNMTVAVGTGTATPNAFDSALTAETDFVNTTSSGFFVASGTTVRYCGTFGQSVTSNQFKESLLRNQSSPSGAIVFCRNTFVTNFIDHNSGSSGFSAAGCFKFIPIA